MKLTVRCTDCGGDRVIGGVNTNCLVLDELALETHSCKCTQHCNNCEDKEIREAEIENLQDEVKKLKLQLAGRQKDDRHRVIEARPIWTRPH